MNLKTMVGRTQLIRKAKSNARIIRDELAVRSQLKSRPAVEELDPQQREALADLRRDGYAVIKGYWSREQAFDMRDRLEGYLKEGKSRDFDNGAYMRFRDGTRESDSEVRRIYHVDALVPELSKSRNDPLVFDIAAAYYGAPMYSGVLIFQHNTQTSSDTRYYHVDWFGREFKAFLYLEDVDEGNGPYTYLRGTHRSYMIRVKKQIFGGGDTGFTDREIKSVLDREVQVTGEAGTLILADVRGIHRGSPQIDRSRSILANYTYVHPGDVFLEK